MIANHDDNKTRAEFAGEESEHRYIVPGLKRGLMVLQLFDQQRVLRLADIAHQTGLPRSTAFRVVYTLESLGFLARTPDNYGYRLASKVLTLGFSYLASVETVSVAREPLAALNQLTGLGVHLAVLDQRDIVHLIRQPSRRGYSSNVLVGQRRPAHATPMGRMLLCELPDDYLAGLYADPSTLVRITDYTPTTLEGLRRMLAADRERGYVVSFGTYVPSGCSVAAPVRDASGTIVAAINISGAREPLIEAELESTLKDELLATAAEISGNLGYRGVATPRLQHSVTSGV